MKVMRFVLLSLCILVTFYSQAGPSAGPVPDRLDDMLARPVQGNPPSLPQSPSYDTALHASGWFTETIDATCNSGESLAIAWGDSPYGGVAYRQECSGYDPTLRYAYQLKFMGSVIWANELVGPITYASNDCRDIDLALDQDDTPFISYQVYSGSVYGYDLRVAWRGESNWQFQELPQLGFQASNSSIAARDGWVYVSYYHLTDSDLRFIKFDIPPTWPPTYVTVDSDNAKGVESAIALRSDDQPRIVYGDSTGRHLKYAATSDGGTTWTTSELVSDNRGRFPDIAIGYMNNTYVSFYDDYIYLDLGFIRRDWIFGWGDPQKVDGDGAVVGKYSSIALNGDGRPCIAYYDETHHDLKFAERQSNGSWQAITVDSGGDVGMYASLAFDPLGNPHIAYYDKTNTRLMHAYYNPPIFLPLVIR